ncbi:UNKNOWN [Stylonychia lemnae]|uniref:Uncharacterized protein n=1 Tax=Stylonychia lemnae TaxID=5949 RepID=A0A078ANT3_STYLE|nr:UNKNOWN [Stylonychia lemnae]|eukprot:CDW83591.1 UNKNOWN [Stylonychia lemnae]
MEIKGADAEENIEFSPQETKEIEVYFPPYSGTIVKETVILYINELELNKLSDTIDFEITFI